MSIFVGDFNEKVKEFVIKHVLSLLFEAEERRWTKNCDKMCDRNSEIEGKMLDGFRYEGRVFKHTRALYSALCPTIHLALWDDMREMLKDRQKVLDDTAAIKQILTRLYDSCGYTGQNVYADIVSATPECIADTLPEPCKEFERMFAVDHFLNHPRDIRQFADVLPKMQFYSATRLLY